MITVQRGTTQREVLESIALQSSTEEHTARQIRRARASLNSSQGERGDERRAWETHD